ncbi:MAG: hypothetical protein V4538_15030 [Bacteroidota bacterium]
MIINGRYFLDNPESGYYEVSKDHYEQYQENYKRFMDAFITPNIDQSKSIKGKIIITSTTADDNNGDEFKKLWQQK